MASIEKYETAGGTRYRVRYRDPAGKSREKGGFKRKKDATDYRTHAEHSLREGSYVDPRRGGVKFAAVAERYQASQARLRKRSWAERTDSILRTHVLPRWGSTAVAAIERTDLKDWLLSIDRSPSTVEDIHGVVHGVLERAVEEKRVVGNVAHKIDLPPRIPPPRVYLTRAQLEELVGEVSKCRELVLTLGLVGLRWGEAVALTPQAVDLDRGRAHIRHSASKVNGSFDWTTPKAWEQRTVALPPTAVAALEPLVAAAPHQDALLWARPDGAPLRPPTPTHWFSKAVGRLVARHTPTGTDGLPTGPSTYPRITAHGLRHTAASLMISAGANVKAVQRQLGHKSAAMTLDTYSDLFDDDLDALAVALG